MTGSYPDVSEVMLCAQCIYFYIYWWNYLAAKAFVTYDGSMPPAWAKCSSPNGNLACCTIGRWSKPVGLATCCSNRASGGKGQLAFHSCDGGERFCTAYSPEPVAHRDTAFSALVCISDRRLVFIDKGLNDKESCRSLAVFVQQSPQLAVGSFCPDSIQLQKWCWQVFFLLSFLPSPCKAKISQQSSHTGEMGRLKNSTNVLEPGIFVCASYTFCVFLAPGNWSDWGPTWTEMSVFVWPAFLKLWRNINFLSPNTHIYLFTYWLFSQTSAPQL